MLYEDGGYCGSDGRRWSTKIEFVCANNATKDNGSISSSGTGGTATDAVKIIEDSNCQLLIQYQTPYACQEQIKCKETVYTDDTSGGSSRVTLDLTPLINADVNYEARIDLPAQQAQNLPKNTKVSDQCDLLHPLRGVPSALTVVALICPPLSFAVLSECVPTISAQIPIRLRRRFRCLHGQNVCSRSARRGERK